MVQQLRTLASLSIIIIIIIIGKGLERWFSGYLYRSWAMSSKHPTPDKPVLNPADWILVLLTAQFHTMAWIKTRISSLTLQMIILQTYQTPSPSIKKKEILERFIQIQRTESLEMTLTPIYRQGEPLAPFLELLLPNTGLKHLSSKLRAIANPLSPAFQVTISCCLSLLELSCPLNSLPPLHRNASESKEGKQTQTYGAQPWQD